MRPAPAPLAVHDVDDSRTRILIVDDHSTLRTALAATLANEPDFEVVALATDGQEAVEQSLRLQPDVVLMDISMPRLGGVEATRRIAGCCPETKVIGLSMYSGDMLGDHMLEAGAVAYISKDAPLDEVIAVIRSV